MGQGDSPVKPFADISLSPSVSPVEPTAHTLTTDSPLKTMKPTARTLTTPKPLFFTLSLLILASTSHAKPLELITPRLTYQQRLDHAIKYHAAKEEVKESFIRAWVMRESSGLDNATRYEPHVAKQRETIDRYLTPSTQCYGLVTWSTPGHGLQRQSLRPTYSRPIRPL